MFSPKIDLAIVMVAAALLFVGISNWLGGEKHLFFNGIRKDLKRFKASRK